METRKDSKTTSLVTTVFLLCGLPGSGKSTLARRFQQELQDYVVRHLEYDKIQDELQSNSNTLNSLQAWRHSRQEALNRLKACLLSAPVDISDRPLVILMDDNFQLRSMRKQVYQVCQAANTHTIYFGILWLDTPFSICETRNQQRSRSVPATVLENLRDTWEEPNPQKSLFWEQTVVRIRPDTVFCPGEWIQQCQPIVTRPSNAEDVAFKQQQRQQTLESQLHSLDKRLRAWVGVVARIKRSHVQQANQARKQILHQAKMGGTTSLEHEDQILDQFQSYLGTDDASWSSKERQELCNELLSTS